MILFLSMKSLDRLMVAIKMYYPYFFLPLIVIYLLFNIFDGNNGLLSHTRLDNEIVKLEQEVNKIKSSNNLYEIKITSLQNQNESLDLLDEQIRNVLGYGKNNEFIIFFDN